MAREGALNRIVHWTGEELPSFTGWAFFFEGVGEMQVL